EVVRARDRAVSQLLDAARPRKLSEGEAAQIDRAERGHVETEIGLVPALRRLAALELPAPLVPRAEGIGDVEDDSTAGRVRTGRKRGAHVHEPNPDPVADAEVHPPRMREQEEE